VIAPAYRPDRDIVASVSAPCASRNLTTRDGAEALAAELDAWWHSRGHPSVKHWAEWVGFAPPASAPPASSCASMVIGSASAPHQTLTDLLAKARTQRSAILAALMAEASVVRKAEVPA
jgi:hypothetical protein